MGYLLSWVFLEIQKLVINNTVQSVHRSYHNQFIHFKKLLHLLDLVGKKYLYPHRFAFNIDFIKYQG